MIAEMAEIWRGDPRGGAYVEKEGKSRATERESVGKSNPNNKTKEVGNLARVGGSWGKGDLRPPQFRAAGVRTPPAAGCGGRRSPALPRPSYRAVGKVIFGKASESSVGKLGGNSLFQDRDRRWPFEILVL
jgi:hypothetical protein